MANEAFSIEETMRLFKEEDGELALATPRVVEAASARFEEEGDHAAANDIHARYDFLREELRILQASLGAGFAF